MKLLPEENFWGWHTRVAINVVLDRARDKKPGVPMFGRAWACLLPQLSTSLYTGESSVQKIHPRAFTLNSPRVKLHRVNPHIPGLCLNTTSRYTVGRVVHPICASWPSTGIIYLQGALTVQGAHEYLRGRFLLSKEWRLWRAQLLRQHARLQLRNLDPGLLLDPPTESPAVAKRLVWSLPTHQT